MSARERVFSGYFFLLNNANYLIKYLVLIGVCTGLDNQGTQFILCFMSNYPGHPTEAQLFISTTSNSGANVNVTTPLYDPDFLESIVVQRAQVVKVRASYYTDEC